MKIKYLNYQQALAIHARYQYLIGAAFDNEGDRIYQILIAPYSRILQWDFVRRIHKGASPEIITTMPCNGRFDILLLPGKPKNEQGVYRMKVLRDYLSEQALDFDLQCYHYLRYSSIE